MASKIEKYQVSWNAGKNEGILILLLEDGSTITQPIDTADEGSFLVDILRNESPVFYDHASDIILTGFEEVGELDVSAVAVPTEAEA